MSVLSDYTYFVWLWVFFLVMSFIKLRVFESAYILSGFEWFVRLRRCLVTLWECYLVFNLAWFWVLSGLWVLSGYEWFIWLSVYEILSVYECLLAIKVFGLVMSVLLDHECFFWLLYNLSSYKLFVSWVFWLSYNIYFYFNTRHPFDAIDGAYRDKYIEILREILWRQPSQIVTWLS
jgi:hypothetical protein